MNPMMVSKESNNGVDKQKLLFSVVIPAYKCADFLTELYERLNISLEKISPHFEIILVNDGSPENDWDIIKQLVVRDERVRGINFSRNFGQHQAISAGLNSVNGEWVIVMDGDLQDQPEEIERRYAKALEGNVVVLARRAKRNDGFWKKLSSRFFYAILTFFTDTKQDWEIANYGIYHHSVVDNIKLMQENFKFFPLSVRWVESNWVSIEVKHASRASGKTAYSLKKLLYMALDIIISYSNKPLKIILNLGFLIAFTSFIYALFIFIRAYTGTTEVVGWPSLIASIWFLSGLIIFMLGVVGVYIGKIFNETKRRPIYLIKETLSRKK